MYHFYFLLSKIYHSIDVQFGNIANFPPIRSNYWGKNMQMLGLHYLLNSFHNGETSTFKQEPLKKDVSKTIMKSDR